LDKEFKEEKFDQGFSCNVLDGEKNPASAKM
jgi:hypothetical protein